MVKFFRIKYLKWKKEQSSQPVATAAVTPKAVDK
jgi:hypothetical protein